MGGNMSIPYTIRGVMWVSSIIGVGLLALGWYLHQLKAFAIIGGFLLCVGLIAALWHYYFSWFVRENYAGRLQADLAAGLRMTTLVATAALTSIWSTTSQAINWGFGDYLTLFNGLCAIALTACAVVFYAIFFLARSSANRKEGSTPR